MMIPITSVCFFFFFACSRAALFGPAAHLNLSTKLLRLDASRLTASARAVLVRPASFFSTGARSFAAGHPVAGLARARRRQQQQQQRGRGSGGRA